MLSERDYIKLFEQARAVIQNSVTAFDDDSPQAKQARKERASKDYFYFAKTYFPHYVSDEFAPVHGEMFKLFDIKNQPVVCVGARDIAKSTILFFSEMHYTLFKRNKFTEYLSDTKERAITEYLFPIKAELEVNLRILSDFGDLRTKYWGLDDFIVKSGKRIVATSPTSGVKGLHYGPSRVDRICVEDLENQNSPKKKSIIMRRIKFIKTDLLKSTNFKGWQFIYNGNYFSKKTITHQLLTSDDFKNWERRIYLAMVPSGSPLATLKLKDKQALVSIWESRMPTKKLLAEQREDPVTFKTERMQKPEDEEAVFKEEWIQWFYPKEINLERFPVVTYHDPSALKGEEHCYKAIISLAVDKENLCYYVIDAWIRKTSKWNSVNTHFDLSEKYHSAVDAIEVNGFQASLKEDYEIIEKKRGKRLNMKLINNRLPKDVRISKLSSLIERGYIKFLKSDHRTDISILIEQLVDFPDGEYVDGPDALAGAVDVADTFVLRKKNQVGVRLLQ